MKNVTKILTAVVLCAALFASDQRISALGGNAALWPGDEANIAAFPGSLNDHALVQFSGIGWDIDATGAATNDDDESATVLFDKDGTTWGFSYDNAGVNWFNMMWGNGDMGLTMQMVSSDDDAGTEASGFGLGWGQTMDFGDVGVNYASYEVSNVDISSLALNWRGDVGFWVFDGLTASYEMGEVGDAEATGLSATAFTHMDASGADVLFAMGVNNMSTDDGAGTEDSYMHMVSTVAVEANMTDWATFRIGATYAYQLSGDNDWTGPGASSGDDGWDLGLGLGFNWGGLSADYTLSQGFFNDPVSEITGYDGGNLTSQGVTLTYSF
jgi:hypothetical protein